MIKTVNNIINTISDILFNIMIMGDDRVGIFYRVISWIKITLIISPLTYLGDILGLWITDNHTFVTFVILAVLINLILGGIKHKKMNTFNWLVLFKKTGFIVIILICVYSILEMSLIIARQNIITDIFRITLQISTILYPGSKVIRNGYILSNGKYPPDWVMKKVYNFETDGNLKEFMDINKKS